MREIEFDQEAARQAQDEIDRLSERMRANWARGVDRTVDAALNPPSEVTVSMTLRGRGAARYHIASEFIVQTLGLSEEEVAGHLLRLGVEAQLARMEAAVTEALVENEASA